MVAVNAFPSDTGAELRLLQQKCRELGVNAVISEVWARGGAGGTDLAREVIRLCEEDNSGFTFAYDLDGSIQEKLEQIVKKIYGGSRAVLTAGAEKQAAQLEPWALAASPSVWPKPSTVSPMIPASWSPCRLYGNRAESEGLRGAPASS